MPREILEATDRNGRSVRFALDVVQEGEHWTSTLARLDEQGEPETVAVAPRFYGVTQEQARRRMIQVLENQYEDVGVVEAG